MNSPAANTNNINSTIQNNSITMQTPPNTTLTDHQTSSSSAPNNPRSRGQQQQHRADYPYGSNPSNRCQSGRGRLRPNDGRRNHNNNSEIRLLPGSSDEVASSVHEPSSRMNRGNNRNFSSQPRAGAAGLGGALKHRQRQKTKQLIEGLSGFAEMEIGIQDNVTPSSCNNNHTGHSNNLSIKKMNLTQLVNRTANPDSRNSNHGSFSNKSHNRNRHKSSSYRDPGVAHKFSKQQFLQANCQFVVLDGHDYSVHRVDPDWPVDWDCIEEIKFKQCASTETSCPICLESPVAAKITKCGHIYCWTCMLHYLSLSDEKCRQCPICFEFVYRNDLRSVVSHSYISHSIDTEIDMRLMVRKKGCVTAEPYMNDDHFGAAHDKRNCDSDGATVLRRQEALLAMTTDYWSQQNLFIVDSQTVISRIVEREERELMAKMNNDQNEPEACFIEQALKMLAERKDRLEQITKSNHFRPTNYQQKSQQLRLQDNEFNASNSQTHLDLSNSFLFYQSCDGQHIYLNPFSTKILCQEYKSLENCPLEIRAKVLQMDWISMNEGWRKRFRYLSHLPLTCEFRLIELDFEKSNLISKATFKMFEDQIKSREMARERARREERKREKIIQVEQDRKIYGIGPSLKININNPDQFPSVSDERYLGLSLATTHHIAPDGTFDLSSDDDENDHTITSEPQLFDEFDQEQDHRSEDLDSSGMALSFREIQLQEAAAAAAANAKAPPANSSWGHTIANNHGSSSSNRSAAPSSSFAKLLLDAKTSKKEWTVKPTSARQSGPAATSAANPIDSRSQSLSSLMKYKYTELSDGLPDDVDDQEELRAPSNFTISDFIDKTIVSGKKSRYKHKDCASGNVKK